MLRVTEVCEVCKKTEATYSDDSGEYCDACIDEIHKQGALDAGIPLSVIEGKTKLTDHFSPDYIESQAFPKGRPV